MKKRQWQIYAKVIEKQLNGLKITKREECLQKRGDAELMKIHKVNAYCNLKRRERG